MRSDGQVVPSSFAAALTLPRCSASWKARSASVRSARKRLGCQPTATPPAPAGPPSGSLGSPGRSALAAYRRRRSEELVAWTRSLTWRAPLVAAAGLTGQVLASQAGLPRAGLGGLAAAALVGWRLRFRPSEQARSWSAGRPRRWDGCWAPGSTPWCACTAPRSMAAACTPRAWPSCPPASSAARSAVTGSFFDAEVALLATTAWTRLHPAA